MFKFIDKEIARELWQDNKPFIVRHMNRDRYGLAIRDYKSSDVLRWYDYKLVVDDQIRGLIYVSVNECDFIQKVEEVDGWT